MNDNSTTTNQISRDRAAALGHETVAILEAGCYVTANGVRVDIGDAVARAVTATVTYGPAEILPQQSSQSAPSAGTMTVEVHNMTTLAGVRLLQAQGLDPAALNFASATHPGGGFLNGARAQEEYLARSTGLWACLRDHPMYAFHQARRDPFYSHTVIYSPAVPVFREDGGDLLETPYACAILTSPAVRASGVQKHRRRRLGEIGPVMSERILKVLAVAERHGHRSLVLGAWGCGAFGNDGDQISGLFRQALETQYPGAFDHVLFAITDWSEDEKYIGPFRRAFGGGQIRLPVVRV
jgi:uncharacterized protein (TIGR02452 family)